MSKVEAIYDRRDRPLPDGDAESIDQRPLLWEHTVYIANDKGRMRYVSLAVSGSTAAAALVKAPPNGLQPTLQE